MTKKELSKHLDLLYQCSKNAMEKDEVPVSAILIFPNGDILSSENEVEKKEDPFAHAEFNVIKKGLEKTNSRYLKGCTLLVSLEPCLFCLAAILKTRIENLFYVLDDEKEGGLSYYHTYVDNRLKVHRVEDERFLPLFNEFFKKLR